MSFPQVFQGWQTLVGFILYRILNSSLVGAPVKLTKIDASGFVSLFPAFLFFTSGILTGSMALSDVPVAAFISISSGTVTSLAFFHADYEVRRRTGNSESTPRNRIGAIATGAAALITLIIEMVNAEHEGYFWLGVHCVCISGFVVYGRIADARFSSSDRQYYCYIFSLIILLPASLYLEEAFEALNFKELRQSLFIAGSLICALSGMGLHLYQCRLRADKNFGRVHHVGLFFVSLISFDRFRSEFRYFVELANNNHRINRFSFCADIFKSGGFHSGR